MSGTKQTTQQKIETRSFGDILTALKKPIKSELVKQREGWRDRNGNVNMVDYVEWHTVADILDEEAPNWSHSVKDIRQIGDFMICTVAITVDGITREGVGVGLAQSEMGIKKAEHDALKRAAVKFGVARELYMKESHAIEREGGGYNGGGYPQDEGFPSNPVARSLGELVSPKQLGMIRAIARELRIDPDEECNEVMNCSTDELTKRAASALIQHLQDKQRGGSAPAPAPRGDLRRDDGGRAKAGAAVKQAAARQQAARSADTGEVITSPTKNKLRIEINHAGLDEADVARDYSDGRTLKLDDLTEYEGQTAIASIRQGG